MADPDDAPLEPADGAPAAAATESDAPPTGLRARDVLNRSAEELEELERQLDPAERAELESWFARPSRVVVEERLDEARLAAEDAANDEYLARLGFGGSSQQLRAEAEARNKRLAELSAAVYPWMYDLLERHARAGAAHRELVPPAPVIDLSITRLRVPDEEELATIGEPRTYQPTPDVADALGVSVPQAVLRDLHRPVEEFERTLVRSDADEAATVDAHREVLTALDWRPEPVTWESPMAEARTAHREFHTGIAESWPAMVAAAKAWRDARRSGP